MSDIAVNAVAIAVFLMTLSALAGPLLHISPLIPAVSTLGFLGLVTADQLSWSGRGMTLFLALFTPAEQKKRLLAHESGHFLVAYCLGISVVDYTLSAWEVFRRGQSGLAGVQFDNDAQTETNLAWQATPLQLERWTTVWMAGIAAEQIAYGKAEGGDGDRAQVRQAFHQAGLPPGQWTIKENWGLLQAKNYLQCHRDAHRALQDAMAKGDSVADCYQILQNSIGNSTTIKPLD